MLKTTSKFISIEIAKVIRFILVFCEQHLCASWLFSSFQFFPLFSGGAE